MSWQYSKKPSYSGLNIVKIISHQTGSCLQNVLISIFAMLIDLACLMEFGALFHNLVASPMKVCLDFGSLRFSDVTLLVILESIG